MAIALFDELKKILSLVHSCMLFALVRLLCTVLPSRLNLLHMYLNVAGKHVCHHHDHF